MTRTTAPAPPTPRRRKIIAAVTLLAASVVATLGVVEVALRLLPDSLRGYQVRSHKLARVKEFVRDTKKNDLGFHDVDHVHGPSERRRVMLLGDSYVQASSVSLRETVGQQLERWLNKSRYRVRRVQLGKGG